MRRVHQSIELRGSKLYKRGHQGKDLKGNSPKKRKEGIIEHLRISLTSVAKAVNITVCWVFDLVLIEIRALIVAHGSYKIIKLEPPILESFEYLDAPVERIAGADIPIPYVANLERLAVPKIEDVVRAAKRTCYRSIP
ncbi:hypothetical protein Droror1_Dr00026737 [Drosera rotundifolia]